MATPTPFYQGAILKSAKRSRSHLGAAHKQLLTNVRLIEINANINLSIVWMTTRQPPRCQCVRARSICQWQPDCLLYSCNPAILHLHSPSQPATWRLSSLLLSPARWHDKHLRLLPTVFQVGPLIIKHYRATYLTFPFLALPTDRPCYQFYCVIGPYS